MKNLVSGTILCLKRDLITMKLKTFIFILFSLGVIMLGVYALTDFSAEEEVYTGESKDADDPPIQRAIASAPEYLEETVLLEQLKNDFSPEANEKLKRLAQNGDAAGYLANLVLAEREGDLDEPAALFYRRALELHATDKVRFQLAEWLAKNGQRDEAIAEYLLLLPDREAMASLMELDAGALEISPVLIEGGHWQTAVGYIKEALEAENLSANERLALTGYLGQSYAAQGDYGAALPYLDEAYGAGLEAFSWWYARTLEATGATAAAASIYEGLGEGGAYRLGLILRDQGKTEDAARTLAKSDNPAAQWQGARLWEELSYPVKAVEVYREMARGDTRYRDDAAYRAYILMERHGLAGVPEMLEVLKEYPAWSTRVTGEATWKTNPTPDYEKPRFIHVTEALQRSGRHELADLELAIGQARAELAEMLALGDWYLEQDDYFRATRWGIRSLNTEKTQHGYYLAYQRPFEGLVREAAQKYKLDPHLIWAVMREESHFRADVDSWVGARGLMQIMPATGQEIAGRKGVEITDNDLLNPEINIDFGAFYLRLMLDNFDGDVDKALAAYNGGQGNVRRWSRSPLGTTPEDFPSVITFLETREYVTKVLNSYHTYNWLYGEN